MSTHERTFIFRSKWCGRRMLKQNTRETVLIAYTYRKLNVFIKVLMQCTCGPVGVLNVVGIHEPLHE